MRKGKHKLFLWPDMEADGRDHTITPSKIGEEDEMDRLEKVSQDHFCFLLIINFNSFLFFYSSLRNMTEMI